MDSLTATFGHIDTIEALLLSSIILLLTAIFLYCRYKFVALSGSIEAQQQNLVRAFQYSLQPERIEISTQTESLIDLATEVWRIEQRINKFSDDISEAQQKGLRSSVDKLKRFLDEHSIEIKDHTGDRFNEGLNLEVLSQETDDSVEGTVVKETVEPTVICNGQIVKKAKVILAGN